MASVACPIIIIELNIRSLPIKVSHKCNTNRKKLCKLQRLSYGLGRARIIRAAPGAHEFHIKYSISVGVFSHCVGALN